MAAVHGEAVLRQRVCRGHGCQAVFFICTHCDRGHCYCSTQCRQQARRRQRRSANRRYQQSPEGRLDHRDRQQRRSANRRHQRSPEGRLDHRERQRAYRCRLRQAQPRVTDRGSVSIVSPASLDCGRADVVEHPPGSQPWHERQPALWLRCRICGRAGRFLDPFPRIPHRR